MITRFRIEAISEEKAKVESALDKAERAMFAHLTETQPADGWELTDDPVLPIDKDGRAMIYGRRVYRRLKKEVPA